MKRTKTVISVGVAAVGMFIVMQFVHLFVPEFQYNTPETVNTINWDSPQTEALWASACADCHSNDTVYPWYSYIAPVRWLVAYDINEGRAELNISNARRTNVREMIEMINEGEMPLPVYTITHMDARLSNAEKQQLIDGLRATFQ